MKFFISALTLVAFAAAAPIAEPVVEVTELSERDAFKGGSCGIHGKLGFTYGALSSATFTIKDGSGGTLGQVTSTGTSAFQKGGLPKLLTIMPNGGYSTPYIRFNYGGSPWDTSSSQCKVGKPDPSWGSDYIQFDCGFSC